MIAIILYTTLTLPFRLKRYILVNADPYLVKPTGTPRFYPALIYSRLASNVCMVWYHGNMYPSVAERPAQATFTLHYNTVLHMHRDVPELAYNPVSATR